MKKKSIKNYAQTLYKTTKGLSVKELTKAIQKFVLILVRDHKIKQVNKIIKEVIKYTKEQEGMIEIEVSSVHQLNDETVKKIALIFGKKTEVKQKIDKNLLGGMIIKTKDRIFDASLKRQLEIMRQVL